MVVTEAQANKTLCPKLSRVMSFETQDMFLWYCEGSGCMWWAWADTECEKIKPEDRRGYCGILVEPA